MAQVLQAYMRYLFKQGIALPNLQLVNFQSMERLEQVVLKLQKAEGQEQLRKLLVFASSAGQTKQRTAILERIRRFPTMARLELFDFYLFPGHNRNGCWLRGFLEDVLVDALRQDTAECDFYQCLWNVTEEFLMCANRYRGKQKLVNHSRHLLYAYFAATERFVGLRLGEAAQAGAFDFEHKRFVDLKRFLLKSLV